MLKILTIAVREYRAMVATKAFLLSITVMPLLMFGSIVAMNLLQKVGGTETRRIVVADGTEFLYPALEAAIATRNEQLGNPASEPTRRGGLGPDVTRFQLERATNPVLSDEERLRYSGEIRTGALYGLLEIPAGIESVPELDVESLRNGKLPERESAKFYSVDSSLSEARQFLQAAINATVKVKRLQQAGIDPLAVERASLPVEVAGMGLVEREAGGKIAAAKKKDELSALMLPMGAMMLMFLVIFLAAQPALESVLEEKSGRIAEVLLGCATPVQLMAGKLLGCVAGSLTIFGIYLLGGYFFMQRLGWMEMIPYHLLPWFIVFQILGVTLYSSVFMAIGASVNQLKEAQSMLLPVWVLKMLPFFIWLNVIRGPNDLVPTLLSFFPPATPTMMVLRLATGAVIPWWQPYLGVAVALAATLLCVFVAARIFRVGLLWQGKTPRLVELFRWAARG